MQRIMGVNSSCDLLGTLQRDQQLLLLLLLWLSRGRQLLLLCRWKPYGTEASLSSQHRTHRPQERHHAYLLVVLGLRSTQHAAQSGTLHAPQMTAKDKNH
jgi:hypothetical protein